MADNGRLFGRTKPAAKPPAPDGGVQRVIAHYCERFAARFHEKPEITGADAATVKVFLVERGVSVETLCQRVTAYLAIEDDEYLEREGYPLRLLRGVWNRLIVQRPVQAKEDRGVDSTAEYLRRLRT